jgi:hypothetical protein
METELVSCPFRRGLLHKLRKNVSKLSFRGEPWTGRSRAELGIFALSIFTTMRDSSSSANKDGGFLGMTRWVGFSSACSPVSVTVVGQEIDTKLYALVSEVGPSDS